jgi:queuine tRNA-ribosyltransferase
VEREKSGWEVVVTRGGERAMLDRATGEVMHPVIGPLAESERLYITPSLLRERLAVASDEPLVLLDVGLGAGTNAAQALRVALALGEARRPLQIVSFEHALGAFELALADDHRAAFGLDDVVLPAAQALLAHGVHRGPRLCWQLRMGDLRERLAQEPAGSADIVFWDPFSPRQNPALWDVGCFAQLRRVCRSGATVHTYSGSTRVRSALLLAGFAAGQGPTTGEKAQTTTAAVDLTDLRDPLGKRWLERLTRSSVPWPDDAPANALAQLSGLAQFA